MNLNENSVHGTSEPGRIARSMEIIDNAVQKYNPAKILGLFSGGHDSLTAVHVAARHPLFSYAVHINTGIGVPETRKFVRATAAAQNWNLREYKALDCGQDYAEMVKEHGFPGPGKHSLMYIRLKERPLRVAIREAKEGFSRRTPVLLISGVRFQESERRMGYREAVTKEGSKIWVNIINDWSKADCNRYLENNKIPRSPVVDKIHKSGECLCGAFAKEGEFAELEFWYPEYANYIKSLPNGKPWGWGEKGRKAWKDLEAERKSQKAPGPMCTGCAGNQPDLFDGA